MTVKTHSDPVSFPQSSSLEGELVFTTSRSSGPGGQHVNKVNSKVTLAWNLDRSKELTDQQKECLVRRLAAKISRDGYLIVTAQESRSQSQNRATVLNKLDAMLRRAFTLKKPRKPTKAGKASHKRRLESKRRNSEKKQFRQKV